MLGDVEPLTGGIFALIHVARMQSRVQDVDGEQMKLPGIFELFGESGLIKCYR